MRISLWQEQSIIVPSTVMDGNAIVSSCCTRGERHSEETSILILGSSLLNMIDRLFRRPKVEHKTVICQKLEANRGATV